MQLAILGRGRLGCGLTHALLEAGLSPTLLPGRSPEQLSADVAVVVLAVPDPAIAPIAARVPELPGRVILHCSGSLGRDALPSHVEAGAMHPLVSFADPERPPSLAGTRFVIAGSPAALDAARAIASAVGAVPLEASLHGPAYHAAAALSANGAAALAQVAVGVLARLGLERKDASAAIGALLCTVGENVARLGVDHALSGPILRGDAAAVRRHREALAALDGRALGAYDAVAEPILECARAAGLEPEREAEVRRALAD